MAPAWVRANTRLDPYVLEGNLTNHALESSLRLGSSLNMHVHLAFSVMESTRRLSKMLNETWVSMKIGLCREHPERVRADGSCLLSRFGITRLLVECVPLSGYSELRAGVWGLSSICRLLGLVSPHKGLFRVY
jgi:hypothetical protein